jgi:hypothetical protein
VTPSTCLGCGAWLEKARLAIRSIDIDYPFFEIQFSPLRFHDYECAGNWFLARHEAEQKARLAEAAK